MAAAERYESEFAAKVLLETAKHLVDRAALGPGVSVLDVGCGTGVVARQSLAGAGPDGQTVGVDISEEMLVVARRLAPEIGWIRADAQLLPFSAGSFDRVLSQFALMFVPDREQALREMWRVLRPGGRLALSVSGAREDSPVNLRLAELVERHAGERGRAVVEEIGSEGASETVATFARAGISTAQLTTEHEKTEYASIEAFMEAEVRGWAPLSELIDDSVLASLVDDARHELAHLLDADGRLRFSTPYYLVVADKE